MEFIREVDNKNADLNKLFLYTVLNVEGDLVLGDLIFSERKKRFFADVELIINYCFKLLSLETLSG